MLNTQSINQNILTSKQDKSLDLTFQTHITEISTIGKKNLITENLIDLCTEPLIDNAVLNSGANIKSHRVEKSTDTIPLHSQIKSHNIQLSTETRDMISFYCIACGHTNRMLTEDINQILIKKNKSNKD
ncbi:3920_t:CDS:1 [Gigaspora margarita]|uniref:3920_t:CDS:1 n=1 Tax=Gigaspora margarita TaxID=4874 RepID=A0ABN7VZC3_GIGMA|nr:3920_t:CDS:1 [Gigaspora margarita]